MLLRTPYSLCSISRTTNTVCLFTILVDTYSLPVQVDGQHAEWTLLGRLPDRMNSTAVLSPRPRRDVEYSMRGRVARIDISIIVIDSAIIRRHRLHSQHLITTADSRINTSLLIKYSQRNTRIISSHHIHNGPSRRERHRCCCGWQRRPRQPWRCASRAWY